MKGSVKEPKQMDYGYNIESSNYPGYTFEIP